MKKLFHFYLQCQKPTSEVRCNTSSLKRFCIKGLVCLSLSCLLLVSSCANIAVTQEQQARQNIWNKALFDITFGSPGDWEIANYFGSGRDNRDSSGLNPAARNWILNGGNPPWYTPPWSMGGGGRPQPTQTGQSCKSTGSPCSSNDECCSRSCNNNTNKCN